MQGRTGLAISVGELLKPGEHREKVVDIETGLPQSDPEVKLVEPVKGSVRFLPAGSGVVAFFSVNTFLELPCSVDSESFRHQMHLEFQHGFEKDLQSADAAPISPDNTVDIGPTIWDEIVVNVPMRPLCPKHKE